MVQNVIEMPIVDWIGTGVSNGDCLLVEFSLVEIARCQHQNRYSCDLHILYLLEMNKCLETSQKQATPERYCAISSTML